MNVVKVKKSFVKNRAIIALDEKQSKIKAYVNGLKLEREV